MKVAAIQMSSGDNMDANLRQAEALMQRAVEAGAECILLPENFAYYGSDYRAFAVEQGNAMLAWAGYWAKQLGIFLLAGSMPSVTRADSSEVIEPKVRTMLCVFNPQGEQIGRYDKLHLFDVDIMDQQGRYRESDVFEAGTDLAVVSLQDWLVGLAICYDLRFGLMSQALTRKGANLLVYPSAFTDVTGAAHWHLLIRTRAIESGCYVLAANQCGVHSAKRKSYGHSLLVDPWGEIIAELKGEPDFFVADISLDRVHEVRSAIPLHQHQRLIPSLG